MFRASGKVFEAADAKEKLGFAAVEGAVEDEVDAMRSEVSLEPA